MRRASLALLSSLLFSCADSFPLPDEFDAAFPSGRVCVPKQIQNSSASSTYPVRFEFCLYRCVTISPDTARLQTAWQCVGDQCNMVMLATAVAHKVPTESGCDANQLIDPPPGECTNTTIQFNATVPNLNGNAQSGNFLVSIPYLELEQGQRVVDRIQAGENAGQVLREEVGTQNYPSRQFQLNFDPAHTTPGALSETDCTPIGLN